MSHTAQDGVTDAVLGAVLVGGASRRMGRDKALIEVDNVAMVDRTAALLTSAGCHPVVAVGPDRVAGSIPAIHDAHPGEGPLGAIITCLEHAVTIHAAAAFVVACDLPDLDPVTVITMLGAVPHERGRPSVTMAIGERREPLVAIWSTACLPSLRRAFDDGERSVHRAVGAATGLVVAEIAVDPRRVRNVNTPDQLRTE